jgi:hypothetical protein
MIFTGGMKFEITETVQGLLRDKNLLKGNDMQFQLTTITEKVSDEQTIVALYMTVNGVTASCLNSIHSFKDADGASATLVPSIAELIKACYSRQPSISTSDAYNKIASNITRKAMEKLCKDLEKDIKEYLKKGSNNEMEFNKDKDAET